MVQAQRVAITDSPFYNSANKLCDLRNHGIRQCRLSLGISHVEHHVDDVLKIRGAKLARGLDVRGKRLVLRVLMARLEIAAPGFFTSCHGLLSHIQSTTPPP